MDQNILKTIDDIIERAKELNGKKFSEIGIVLSGNKGIAGQVIEKWFGLKNNSKSEADFLQIGIDLELKISPIRKVAKGDYSAKERMSLGMLNYFEDYIEKDFKKSHVYNKIKNTLVVNYLVDNTGDYKFVDSYLLAFSDEELKVIESDYKKIINLIEKGHADKLSDSLTTFLAATTKGAGKDKTFTKQPNSNELAKKRAWTFKTGFITRKTREHYTGVVTPVYSGKEILINKIKAALEPYIGMSADEIIASLGNKPQTNKAKNANAINQVLKSKKINIKQIDDYTIQMKTMIFSKTGMPQESISFRNIDFDNLKNIDFEDTDIYDFLENGILVNKFDKDGRYVETFLKTFSNEKITVARKIFDKTKSSLSSNKVFLPKMKDNTVIHIRPKAKDGSQKIELPDGTIITKSGWWINRKELK